MYRKLSGIKTIANAGFADALSDNTRSLQSYARRLAGNAPDADDLVQDHIAMLVGTRDFPAWDEHWGVEPRRDEEHVLIESSA
jgi:DNA-directed RNA polymerase specialized sigma24 family protein